MLRLRVSAIADQLEVIALQRALAAVMLALAGESAGIFHVDDHFQCQTCHGGTPGYGGPRRILPLRHTDHHRPWPGGVFDSPQSPPTWPRPCNPPWISCGRLSPQQNHARLRRRFNTYLQDSNEYRAIARRGGTIIYILKRSQPHFGRHDTSRINGFLAYLADELNTIPTHMLGDPRLSASDSRSDPLSAQGHPSPTPGGLGMVIEHLGAIKNRRSSSCSCERVRLDNFAEWETA
jgi:hypothetical protein